MEKYRRRSLNLFELAQRIYGPSYISFESALSHHGWIPESVPTITSASAKRSKTFSTPLGVFSFIFIPVNVFLIGVNQVSTGVETFFIATPWRAIGDYVYAYKKDWNGIHPLIQSLRIDEEHFAQTSGDELSEIQNNYRSRRVKTFFKGVLKDLSL